MTYIDEAFDQAESRSTAGQTTERHERIHQPRPPLPKREKDDQ
jgi:hypothetical protein